MQQTSLLFSRKLSYPLAKKALTIALSIGAHYLLASNLGIFGFMKPVTLTPVKGTVKVVDLTPAERTRVPEAVKSNPLPIAQNTVNPAPVTQRFTGIPNAPRTDRGNITSPTPSTNPTINDAVRPPRNNSTNPKTSPSSSSSSTPTPTQSKDPKSSQSQSQGLETPRISSGKPGPLDGSTSSQASETSSSSAGKNPKNSGGSNPTVSTTPTPPPSPAYESQASVSDAFEQDVIKPLVNVEIEELTINNPGVYRESVPGCRSSISQDTYITVGLEFSVFKPDPNDRYYNTDAVPPPKRSFKVSRNATDPEFVKKIVGEGLADLSSAAIKKIESIPEATRYSVKRFFHTKLVYPAKSCTR